MAYRVYAVEADRQAARLFARLMDLWFYQKVEISDRPGGCDIFLYRDGALPPEGFKLECSNGRARVYGGGASGVIYGVSALVDHYAANGFSDIKICETPRFPFRGAHLFLPPRQNIEAFKCIIDMLVYLKYNTLILEVGGGMEYKNHPEINAGWETFCKQMETFPGGPVNMQGTDTFPKDSTHTELGGGSYVPQDAVREIVEYAKAYGMDVIPELQMLSHAYYITAVYPELAERIPDFNPDTVCPRNEDAYKLYFELAEEVIDVFGPSTVSIGHDEIRMLGLCEQCRPYTGHELLAYEINRLHEFYKSRNIRIMMWAEKLMTTVSYFSGRIYGGGDEHGVNRFGREWTLPASYDALKMIPKDVLLMDWLYLASYDSQTEAEKNGFQQIFGNFCGELTRKWEARTGSPHLLGAEVSSWVLADEYTLGRDGIIGELWYSSHMLWGNGYDENRHDAYIIKMQNEMPMLREMLKNRRSAFASEDAGGAGLIYAGANNGYFTLPAAALPERGVWGEIKKTGPPVLYGTPVGDTETYFTVGKKTAKIVFLHTCLATRDWVYSYYMPVDEYYPLVYAVRYADGATLHIRVMFGTDIGYIDMDFGRRLNYSGRTPTSSLDRLPEYPWKHPDPPIYELNFNWKNSLLYSAAPFIYEGRCYYSMEWDNPRPDVPIDRVFAVNNAKKRDEQAVLFAAAVI